MQLYQDVSNKLHIELSKIILELINSAIKMCCSSVHRVSQI